MSDIGQITDYNADLALILEQFKDSDNLKGLIQIANNSANDIETAIFEIKDNFYIDTAVGAQLDIIGIIFSVDRSGQSDADYRAEIKQQSSIRYSGEPESIISILKSLYGATYVNYRENYPGQYYVETDAVYTEDDLYAISPAGVGALFEVFYVFEDGDNMELENGDFMTGVSITL